MTDTEQLARIRDLLRPVLGTEPCPECGGSGTGTFETPRGRVPCSACRGQGTRDVVDGLSVEDAVRRVVADRAAVAEMRERAAAKIEQQSALLSSMFDDRHEPLCRDLAAAIRALTAEEK